LKIDSPDDLSDVGGDEITNELLHVVVDGPALLNGGHDGGEVVVSQYHLRSRLGHGGTRTHGDTNLSLLQGRGVIHTVTSLETNGGFINEIHKNHLQYMFVAFVNLVQFISIKQHFIYSAMTDCTLPLKKKEAYHWLANALLV